MKFSVILVWWTKRFHRYWWKSGVTPVRLDRKWALKVLMAHSAAFLLCMFGGKSWNFVLHFLVISFLYAMLALFSKI